MWWPPLNIGRNLEEEKIWGGFLPGEVQDGTSEEPGEQQSPVNCQMTKEPGTIVSGANEKTKMVRSRSYST